MPPGVDRGFLHVIDNVVRPIIDDFRPDIVINSAGQDNHFSDPITNMHFSARGYALLNQRLHPDIAVLEGGYAIQGALPCSILASALPWRALISTACANRILMPQPLNRAHAPPSTIKLSEELVKVYFNPP